MFATRSQASVVTVIVTFTGTFQSGDINSGQTVDGVDVSTLASDGDAVTATFTLNPSGFISDGSNHPFYDNFFGVGLGGTGTIPVTSSIGANTFNIHRPNQSFLQLAVPSTTGDNEVHFYIYSAALFQELCMNGGIGEMYSDPSNLSSVVPFAGIPATFRLEDSAFNFWKISGTASAVVTSNHIPPLRHRPRRVGSALARAGEMIE
jgi:hypothetical protein